MPLNSTRSVNRQNRVMEKIVLVLHVLTALAIIGTIMIQQGKGAEAGASFGSGASQTMFGSAGGWNFFSKFTAILATVFFLTSFGLAVIAKNNAGVKDVLLPELEAVQNELEAAEEIPLSEALEGTLIEGSLDSAADIPSPQAGEADVDTSAEIPVISEE